MKIQNALRITRKNLACGLAIALTTLLGAVASLAQTSPFTVGLNNPAKITVAGGSSLLVSEAGTTAPNSGRISLVNRTTGARQTLIDGLPSAVNNDGGAPETSGPAGLKQNGQKLYVTTGAGNTAMPVTGGFIANPAPSSPLFDSILELTLPADYETLASGFALSFANQMTLNGNAPVTLTNAEGKQLTVRLVANLPDYVSDPRPTLPENIRTSNLYGIELSGGALYITDASFNLLYRVQISTGASEVFTTFAYKPNPTTTGPPVIEPVPDSIRLVGSNLYVSFLSGFPFVAGLAEVKTVNLNTRQQAVLIPNLTSALDVLPFNGTGGDTDSYLVLEFSANMLAQAPGRIKLFTSPSESPRIIADNLITPTSITRDAPTGAIFVTEKATGRILRVNAPHAATRDYFGTGKSNYVINNAVGGNIRWDILRNTTGTPAQTRRVTFGLSTDTPVYGDFDGDLKQDIAVWREGTAANPQSYFYLLRSSQTPNDFAAQPWGTIGDKPIAGDFDGDGKTDFCVTRRINNQIVWIILPSGGGAVRYLTFGLASDRENPAAADFNGDGRDDLIVTRTDANGAMTHYIGDANTGALVLAQQWGNSSIAATSVLFGDYTGDSRADIAVNYGACPSNPTCDIAGTWWITPTGGANYTVTKFGIPFNAQTGAGDRPNFGDYDGDGKFDISVFRPSNNTNYTLGSANGQLFAQFWDGTLASSVAKNTPDDAPLK